MAIEFSHFQRRHALEYSEPAEPPEPRAVFQAEPHAEPPGPDPAAAQPEPASLLLRLPAAPLAPDYVAVGEPVGPSVLNELEPTHFELTATATVAANDPAHVATSTAAVAAPTTAYVGEPPVTADWLAARETAFSAIRSDYEAQRAQAQAQAGNGPGWVEAQMVTDESGRMVSASGAATVFIADPGAAPQVIGYDESGPVYGQPAGRHVEFSEAAFAAHYRAQGSAQPGTPLQTLAGLYDTDASTLLARHPDIWGLATSDRALNAGPAPAGRAMGDPGQLAMLDLYMADPQVAELIQRHGGSVAPATSGIALEQVRLHGQARYEQMTRLAGAMQAVRNDYSSAMQHAMVHGGPGWVEQPRMVTTTDESGVIRTEQMVSRDESGVATPLTERFFDPDRFTAWYLQQSGAANQAFASFYGQSHTQWGSDESGARVVSHIGFDNPNWQMGGPGGPMSHNELRSLDPNHAPRLNNDSAVGFDFEAGWATHHSNIHQKRDWFETVVQVAFVAAASYFTAGAAAGAGWGVVGSAAGAGAAGSFVSGAMNGDLSLKGVLRGALSGALTVGLVGPVGDALGGGAVGGLAARMTVQGGIQALLGGRFQDGALAGLASGLATLAAGQINASIGKAVEAKTMTDGEAFAARIMGRVVSSAIRAMGDPDDPGFAVASGFLNDLVTDGLDSAQQAQRQLEWEASNDAIMARRGNESGANPVEPHAGHELSPIVPQGTTEAVAPHAGLAPAPRLAFDDDGKLIPDPFGGAPETDDRTAAERIADQLGVPRDQIVNAGLGAELARSAEVLAGFAEGAGISILATGQALVEVASAPMQFVNGVRALLTSAEARGQFRQDVIDRVRVDIQMLEDAFNAGDLRGTGQQLGKLTTDLAQVVGGVEALARLGVSASTAGGRVLISATQSVVTRVADIRSAFAGVQLGDDIAMRIANNFGRDGDMFTQAAQQMAAARAAGWRTSDGKVWWPPGDGAIPGTQLQATLQPGTRLDRFGGTTPTSSFLSPVEVAVDQRALRPSANLGIRDEYIVVRSFTVEQSNVMPWFGKPGMGIQFDTAKGIGVSIADLEKLGYIRKVGP